MKPSPTISLAVMNRIAQPFLLLTLFAFSLFGSSAGAALPVPPPPQLDSRAWLLIDAQSGAALAEKAPDHRVEPASLTKLMTAYLTFAALREGRLKLDQALPVSERAWRMEGSRMFLDPRRPATVDDLLKGVIVQSGNDACVVLAEAIAGSEEGFATMMNQMAKRLGMHNTNFVNSTGLPHAQHYSTARDLARLAHALIRDYPEHYRAYYSMREFTWSGITQPNRNRLLWMDGYVDGLKTGHTQSAGFCLVASARRDERRLISVVLGAGSDAARAMQSQQLLNYGFQFFETVKLYDANQSVSGLRVYKGKSGQVKAGFPHEFHVTVPRGGAARVQAEVVSQQPLLAPIDRGQRIATLRLTLDGKVLGEYPMQALEAVKVSGFLGRLWDSLLLWFK